MKQRRKGQAFRAFLRVLPNLPIRSLAATFPQRIQSRVSVCMKHLCSLDLMERHCALRLIDFTNARRVTGNHLEHIWEDNILLGAVCARAFHSPHNAVWTPFIYCHECPSRSVGTSFYAQCLFVLKASPPFLFPFFVVFFFFILLFS